MKLPKLKFLVISLWFIVWIALSQLSTAYALTAVDTYQIADNQAVSGDVITDAQSKGLVRSNVTYDNRMFGILEDNPVAVYRDNSAPNNRPIVRSGDTIVNVTDYNGAINPGDYLTSSPIDGKAMKANQSGEVLGIVTGKVTTGNKINFQGRNLTTGQVEIAVNIEYADLTTARSTVQLFSAINNALFSNVQNPEQFQTVVRYIIAGIIGIVAFALGFIAFTRSISKGIEAIGRNPLAKTAIQVSIGMEIGLTIITSLAGIALAFIIIRF